MVIKLLKPQPKRPMMNDAEKLIDLVRLLLDIERDCANNGLTHTHGLSAAALMIAQELLENHQRSLVLAGIGIGEDFSQGIKLVAIDGEKVD